MGWKVANPWTSEEVAYLKNCHQKVNLEDAVRHLKREKTQVYSKMHLLGLKFKSTEPPTGMIWRDSQVPGILASETGLLWSEKKQQLIEPSISTAGDYFIRVDGQSVNVSKIIYEAFYGKITDNRQVFRKDRDPANSDIANLICITRAEARARGMWGIQHPIAIYKSGKLITVYPSAIAAAKAFGVTYQTITNRAEGKTLKRSDKRSAKLDKYEVKYLNSKKQSANRQDILARKKRANNESARVVHRDVLGQPDKGD